MMGYAIKMMILFFIKYLLEWVGCWWFLELFEMEIAE